MPQLVKGGKHAFGWSRVGNMGRLIIPPEALEEYGLKESEKLILVPGSRTSGGFGLRSQESVRRSSLGVPKEIDPRLRQFRVAEGEVIQSKGKPYCWVQLRNRGVTVPLEILEKYGIRIGDKLLAIRGSALAVSFAVRGPVVAEADKHPELEVFEPETDQYSGFIPGLPQS